MNGATTWKIWLVFAGVFLAGGVAGGFVALRVADKIVERGRASGQFAPRMVEHLSDRLELSEAQTGELRVLVEAAWGDLRDYRRASRDTMQELSKKIATILTEEQRRSYAKMQETQRQRWQAMDGDRRGAGPGRGGPSGKGMQHPDGGPPPPHDRPPPPQ